MPTLPETHRFNIFIHYLLDNFNTLVLVVNNISYYYCANIINKTGAVIQARFLDGVATARLPEMMEPASDAAYRLLNPILPPAGSFWRQTVLSDISVYKKKC